MITLRKAAHVNVVTDAALWKVSEDTETSAIIENILDDVVPVVTANVPSGANLYAVSVNRANMRNGPSTRNGVIAKLERGTAVQLLPSSSEIARRRNKSRGLDFQKTVEKS